MTPTTFPWPIWLRAVPWGLTTLRLALAPVILVLVAMGAPGEVLAGCIGLGLYTDLLDGVVARRVGVAAAALRRYDCAVDVVFWLAVLAAAWIRHSEVLAAYFWPIAGLVGLETACEALSLARFRRIAATHAWSCKAWGVLLAAAFAALFVLGRGDVTVPAAVTAGYVAYLDVHLILLLAPRCPVDVPSAWHAWKLPQAHAEEAPDGMA